MMKHEGVGSSSSFNIHSLLILIKLDWISIKLVLSLTPSLFFSYLKKTKVKQKLTDLSY